jgi:predicted tellurium resistance membrane protein TerC
MIEMLMSPEIWASFLTLCVLEIVLGIDNIIFLSIITGKLPKEKQATARMIGLSLALGMRIALLFCIAWMVKMQSDLFTVFGKGFSLRDLILAGGGLFLLWKATTEIHHEMEEDGEQHVSVKSNLMASVIMQIVVIDLVFSLDSILTAIGIAEHIPVMVAAIVVAILVMLFAARPVSDFVNAHPTVKMLALSFLILVGMVLVADAFDYHIERGYLYFAIAFSMGVETLNLLKTKKRKANKSGH